MYSLEGLVCIFVDLIWWWLGYEGGRRAKPGAPVCTRSDGEIFAGPAATCAV